MEKHRQDSTIVKCRSTYKTLNYKTLWNMFHAIPPMKIDKGKRNSTLLFEMNAYDHILNLGWLVFVIMKMMMMNLGYSC